MLNYREAQDLFFYIFCLIAARWADDAKACACVVTCLFRGGDAACFRVATAWRIYFYGKTLHSLKWQPETDECVYATDSVKMRVRILTSCKNRVKTSYKQEIVAIIYIILGIFS